LISVAGGLIKTMGTIFAEGFKVKILITPITLPLSCPYLKSFPMASPGDFQQLRSQRIHSKQN